MLTRLAYSLAHVLSISSSVTDARHLSSIERAAPSADRARNYSGTAGIFTDASSSDQL